MSKENAMRPAQLLNRSLYLQVRDDLARRIAAGEWKPSAALPNEGDLSRQYGVSSGTMRKALDLLEEQHLLSRRQGRGTFVNDHSTGDLACRFAAIHTPNGKLVVGDVDSPSILRDLANDAERAKLDLVKGDYVYRIERLRTVDGKPLMWERASVPAELFANLEQDGFAHSIVALAQEHGVLLGTAEERISTTKAPADVAKALAIDVGSPIAVLDRIVHSMSGDPVEWRVAWCELSENHYLAQLG